jgi:UPF0042 nucleotide-binding protein
MASDESGAPVEPDVAAIEVPVAAVDAMAVDARVQPRSATRRLTLLSFGFKFGPPPTNYYFDVSFLKNPARESQWDLFSRVTPRMREFVLAQPACRRFLDRMVPLLKVLIDCDDDVRVGIGCSAGRHRSAIVVEEIARRMEGEEVLVKILHREEAYQ